MVEYCERKFGNVLITINYEGHICIANDWAVNWGAIYDHMIEVFKRGSINPCTGYRHQVIGMDFGVAETHKNWIYSKIEKGYFDHLIKD